MSFHAFILSHALALLYSYFVHADE